MSVQSSLLDPWKPLSLPEPLKKAPAPAPLPSLVCLTTRFKRRGGEAEEGHLLDSCRRPFLPESSRKALAPTREVDGRVEVPPDIRVGLPDAICEHLCKRGNHRQKDCGVPETTRGGDPKLLAISRFYKTFEDVNTFRKKNEDCLVFALKILNPCYLASQNILLTNSRHA